jgi:hypothetical protein
MLSFSIDKVSIFIRSVSAELAICTRANETIGRATGDKKQEVKGDAQQVAGEARKQAGDVKEAVKDRTTHKP